MDETERLIKEAIAYYVDRADNLKLPEECPLAEELADQIWHLEETLTILRRLNDDGE